MRNFRGDFDKLIQDVFTALGRRIRAGKDYEIVDRGVPHTPPKELPPGKMAICTFSYDGRFLKIGKVGSKSSALFISQHYNSKWARKVFADKLIDDEGMEQRKTKCKDWIKENCRRIDILVDAEIGDFTLELVEAVLRYHCKPKYDAKSQ